MKEKVSLFHRLLPLPFVSFLVAISWLMLGHSLDLFDILVAIFLGIVIPKLIEPFLFSTPKVRWTLAFKLFFVVLWDIIISNIRVAKQVLGPSKNLHPKWFRVPLDSEHEHVNTLLAMIITTTPGTVSAGIDQERGDILVHALSTDDVDGEIDTIKQRYEQPLLAIFNVEQGDQT
ncbi:Na+/H+ antiporter subunit E [Acinetobacter gerneri]|uniref:Na+/H+ antiporter subunit E n=1 Tax=Acinetobacter gerneri TaxID=202952 RepID=UPI0029369FAB|nr:Na+/H+ antiporter subunit E [Acinetobacter gerneri]MDV2437924.1 Na+/H+ antiporter subunit E [Acinetobacter gerneri]